MSEPLVSILMPAYRHETYITEAIASVLGQTEGDFELIVIDDASPDGTWEAIERIDDPRIRATRHETNQGAHATLNEALRAASGRFIAILNSDDHYRPERLARLLSAHAAAGHPETLLFSDVAFIDAAGAQAPEHHRAQDYLRLRGRCEALPAHLWWLAGNPAITTSNFFFPRSLSARVGGFADLRYTHDWEWAIRASCFTPPIWVHEALIAYRVHPANTLAEDDIWRHIHENTLIQTRAWAALGPLDADASQQAVSALLANDSLHPLPLLCALLRQLGGTPPENFLRPPVGGEWPLRALARKSGLADEAFYSAARIADLPQVIARQAKMVAERLRTIEHMNQEIADRDATIAAQHRMVEDRLNTINHMSQEIAHRDSTIATQAGQIEEQGRTIQELSDSLTTLRSAPLMRLYARLQRIKHALKTRTTP